MKEYNVVYYTPNGGEAYVVKPSFWKLLLWFCWNARHCSAIKIFVDNDWRYS